MATTKFAVAEKYKYLNGLGSYHQSDALPGAAPVVINSPQKPPYGLVTERISGTSMTAPRHENLQTWMYRCTSSLDHTEFEPLGPEAEVANRYSPNSYIWGPLPRQPNSDWLSQKLLAKNGDAMTKTGLAIWIFNIDQDMEPNTVFSSLDGDCLLVPQAGAIDIQTELGNLLVRQNEIAVIPRGIRYQLTLPAGPCRGYVCELYQGHFQLPNLGVIGSTGLANVRDFQVPCANFDGSLENGSKAEANNAIWTIVSRQAGRLWRCKQNHTPFDVAAWHGTYYPFKYDLARFCVMGNMLFDEHDPCLYTVMTAPSHREPGAAVVDFAIIPPRWNVAQDTLWLPYYHRNTMTEFYGPIVNNQEKSHPFNQTKNFSPFGAGMNGPFTSHGSSDSEYEEAVTEDLAPKKLMTDGITLFLLETEMPLYLTDWAAKSAALNHGAKPDKSKL